MISSAPYKFATMISETLSPWNTMCIGWVSKNSKHLRRNISRDSSHLGGLVHYGILGCTANPPPEWEIIPGKAEAAILPLLWAVQGSFPQPGPASRQPKKNAVTPAHSTW
jgi:hypothetical protein